jgi:hypothetical protein
MILCLCRLQYLCLHVGKATWLDIGMLGAKSCQPCNENAEKKASCVSQLSLSSSER